MKKSIFLLLSLCLFSLQVLADESSSLKKPTLTALPEGGSFSGDEMQVTITNPQVGNMVRYTLSDALWPTESSQEVKSFTDASKTITISTTTTIRAIYVDGPTWNEERDYSETVGRTYYKNSEILGYANLRAVVDPENTSRDAYFGTFYADKNWTIPNGVTTLTAYYDTNQKWVFSTAYSSGAALGGDPMVLSLTCWNIYGYNDIKAHPEFVDMLSQDKKTLRLPIVASSKEGSAIRDKTYVASGQNDMRGFTSQTDLTTQSGYDASSYYYALQMHHDDGVCVDASGNINKRTCSLCGISDQPRCPHIGFFWMNSTGEGFTTGANRAYLCVPKSYFDVNNPARQGFLFSEAFSNMAEGETTGISKQPLNHPGTTLEPPYTLSGQRVNTPAKGIVIVNGKKIIK